MLEDIRSSYIAQIIFSKIIEEKKLKMVRFNKALQKKLNINLINYKIFGGKYIIHEKGGIVKEYNSYNDGLMFEGEYKNVKKNGTGKEYNYYTKKIWFEGEYKNGKRNGRGKEYDSNTGNIIFEGEYISGIKWTGKGYNENNEIEYEIKELIIKMKKKEN